MKAVIVSTIVKRIRKMSIKGTTFKPIHSYLRSATVDYGSMFVIMFLFAVVRVLMLMCFCAMCVVLVAVRWVLGMAMVMRMLMVVGMLMLVFGLIGVPLGVM
ncbi:MAG: hypothetical protein HGB26_04960, partial [Desulfobulbaceae bacterium]|nr:hypothetical protein [Desulfobulbaceae bacterium]